MYLKLSAIDPSKRQAAQARGRIRAFDFLSKMMLALLFVAVLVAMELVSALFHYLQVPKWIDSPGLVFVLGLAGGCAAVFAAAAHWRWKVFRFIVRNAWWPNVAAYRAFEIK